MESIANNVNCLFRISLKIDEILDHEILKAYFSSDAFSQKERNLYKKIKLNAEELIKRGDMIPNLKINIKNGNIYKNGTLVFEDNFYCSFFIPYDLKNFKKDHYSRYG